MKKEIKKKFIKKIGLTYVIILILVIFLMKYRSGGGKGRLEPHYSITWEQVLLNLPYYAIGSLFICYPSFYVFYKAAKKENDENKNSTL